MSIKSTDLSKKEFDEKFNASDVVSLFRGHDSSEFTFINKKGEIGTMKELAPHKDRRVGGGTFYSCQEPRS